MRPRGRHTTATMKAGAIVAIVARIVALAWLVPALMVNVDWSGETPLSWNLAAAGSILCAALFIEGARLARSWTLSPTFLVAALFLVLVNVQVAFEHATHRSDDRSDHRKSAIIAAEKASSQRSQWSQSRTEAAMVAGERTPDSYEADIQARILRDAKRWQATKECDPLHTTAGASMTFCSEVAELRSKKAAAEKRDELDAKIAELDAKTEGAEIVTSADPFADGFASFMMMFGVKLSDDVKHAISVNKDVMRAVALELIAALGPSAWLLMVNGLVSGQSPAPAPAPAAGRPAGPAARPERQPEPKPTASAAGPPVAPPPVPVEDPFHAFVAERLEDANGITTKANVPWAAWQEWCRENGHEIGSQKTFGGKMKTRFAHDQNNNRPVYLNVRVKPAAPALRVVASN